MDQLLGHSITYPVSFGIAPNLKRDRGLWSTGRLWVILTPPPEGMLRKLRATIFCLR
jgi:hypothetical protein